jgi:hypothetical protein
MSSLTPWVSRVNPVADGEQVKALIANRYPGQLDQRTQNLKDRLDLLQASQALYLFDVPFEDTVLAGHAVYWDVTTLSYRKAIAKVEYNALLGGYVVAKSSYVVGICIAKSTSVRGDLIQIGYMADFDFTNGIGSSGALPIAAGAYYLSGTVAGMYTQQKPPISVYIAFLHGDGSANVNPTPKDMLDSHIHYRYALTSDPAGTLSNTLPGQPYVYSAVDNSLPGWLPANDVIFGGVAPAGAVFGYNLSAHPELERVWPPQPYDLTYMEKNTFPLDKNLFVVDANGLWWMENCYGRAPWATHANNPSPSSSSISSSSSSSSFTCEELSILEDEGYLRSSPEKSELALYFIKMVYKNGLLVTSLQPVTGSPIKVVGCDGLPATHGDLKLDLDLALTTQENDFASYGLKGVTGTTFGRGPILTGVKPGSNIVITPVPNRGFLGTDGVYRGEFNISANLIENLLGGTPELVALDGVRQQTTDGIFYLIFPQDLTTSMQMRIGVPTSGVPAEANLRLWFWLLSKRNSLPLPDLACSYRKLAAPGAACEKGTLPTADIGLNPLTSSVCGNINSGEYIEVESDPIPVINGDMVFFTLQRVDSGGTPDGYDGDVGVARFGYSISL